MTTNINYLVSLLDDLKSSEWTMALRSVLTSPDIVLLKGYPLLERASFTLGMARTRSKNSARLGLRTFGLDDLILMLGKILPETMLQNYSMETKLYGGSCFVLDGKLIGCEFVEKGLERGFPIGVSGFKEFDAYMKSIGLP